MISVRFISCVICLLAQVGLSTAFAPTRQVLTSSQSSALHLSDSSQQAGLFGGMFNKGPSSSTDDDPEKGVPIFDIPLSSIKVGGLRIALSLHSIGQQNTPSKGTWLANQAEDGVIEMWFNPDQSGMYSITLTELVGGKGKIEVDRHGPQPSLMYQLQESLQLHKLLDELDTLTFGNEEEVDEENRLLKLEDEDAINQARAKLPARAAEE